VIAIYKKELRDLLSGYTGSILLSCTLLVAGLWLWAFNSDANLLNYGFVDLAPFFTVMPPLFLLLAAALSMGSFSLEHQRGTIELLETRPLSYRQLFWGKWLAIASLLALTLLATISMPLTLDFLAQAGDSMDLGSTLNGYLGLLLLAVMFVSIGTSCSALVKNPVVAFVISAFLMALIFYGPDGLTGVTANNLTIEKWGGLYHYRTLVRGILDVASLVYFLSVSVFFFALSESIHSYRKNKAR
jgi:ABC-2 type transport system permease protein